MDQIVFQALWKIDPQNLSDFFVKFTVTYKLIVNLSIFLEKNILWPQMKFFMYYQKSAQNLSDFLCDIAVAWWHKINTIYFGNNFVLKFLGQNKPKMGLKWGFSKSMRYYQKAMHGIFWVFAWSCSSIKTENQYKWCFAEWLLFEVFRLKRGPKWIQHEAIQVLPKVSTWNLFCMKLQQQNKIIVATNVPFWNNIVLMFLGQK